MVIFLGKMTTTYAQDFERAGAYNNFIVEECNKVYDKNNNYISYAVHSKSANKVAMQLRSVIKQLERSINKIEKMPPFKGDVKFRNEALAVLKLELQTFNVDHSNAVKLKEASEDSYIAMEKYYKAEEMANKKLREAYKRFDKAQEDFAKKNDIEITSDMSAAAQKREQTSEMIAKVSKYSRAIYLSSFRVSKAKAGFLDAIEQKNPALVERKRQELLAAAKIESAKLDTIAKAFDDDNYKAATVEYVKYNLLKADGDYKELAALMKNINKLSQEEVEKYNAIIQEMNETGKALSDKMNETQEELLKNHVPEPEESTDI